MNVSELARKLNIPQQELREILPQIGFDIGAKAIKVDNVIANRILRNWSRLYRQYLNEQQKLREEKEKELKAQRIMAEGVKTIHLHSFITVKDFALKLDEPLIKVMQELMKNGVLTTLNEKIDYDTASIIADEFGYKTELIKEKEIAEEHGNIISEIIANEDKSLLRSRPPVVVVMGHVDHGKTKLLDTIRKTNVVAKESGGITQHIGAYQAVKSISNIDGKKEDRLITFIDTPGHEAFTAMRSRGAKIADIAVLVVAADDGVKPQTKEAIKIIQQANLPMIVAINKIDKEGANIEKTKKELSDMNLIPEDWGGNIPCLPISARVGTGIEELLENIILTAELNEDKIKANPKSQGVGTVIESHINKGEGPVATIIVQNGTIYRNEYINIGDDIYGKIRSMKNHLGEELEKAEPSTPVKILGLRILPRVGDIITTSLEKVGKSLKKKNFSKVTEGLDWHKESDSQNTEKSYEKELNILLKTDVVGSLEAIVESLAKIESTEVKINIVKKGLGNITEGDVITAKTDNAIILGFNVILTQEAEKLALENDIEFHKYKIIYELLDFIKGQIALLTEPKYEEIPVGKMQVLAIFREERQSMIIGGKVIEGEIKADSIIKVARGNKIITEGKLTDLESAKQKVTVCTQGQECGIKYEGKPLIKGGDVLEVYIKREIKK